MAKNFAKGIMASEDVQSMLLTGAFYADDERAELPDGSLVVVKDDIEPAEVYSYVYGHGTAAAAPIADLNRVRVEYPEAATDRVCVADYVGREEGFIGGVRYRDGIKTYGLPCPADELCRIRVLGLFDGYWTDADNFESAPTVGQFAIPTAGKGTYTPAAAKATDKMCWLVVDSKPVIEGMVNSGIQYYLRLVNVI